MKVAVYCRVSTEEQELSNQINILEEYCKKQDFEVFKVYTDVISGKEEKRPGFNQMFEDAHKLLFDMVLFWALDRFSRSGTLFTLQRLNELTKLGIKWHSYQEPYFSSLGEFGDIVISVMSTLAKIERQRISERTRVGLERTRKRGTKLGRPETSNYQIKQAQKLYKELGFYNAVAKRMHLSRNTVKKYVKKGNPEKT